MQSAMSMLAEQIASAVESYHTFTGDYPASFSVVVERPRGSFQGQPYPVCVRIANAVMRPADAIELEDTDGKG